MSGAGLIVDCEVLHPAAPKRRMDIYFAHSMRDYGTPRSQDTLRAINDRWPSAVVHDPERFEHEFREGIARDGADKTYARVLRERLKDRSSSIMVALEHAECVGKGVCSEVRLALQREIPTYVLRKGCMVRVTGVRRIEGGDWAVHYAKLTTEEDV